jgi:uncharacterized protein YndB with AHSA1/START domain
MNRSSLVPSPGADPRAVPAGPRQFACFTPVAPSAVWAALTATDQRPGYLYGWSACSSWESDAPVHFGTSDGYSLIGRVLHAEAPRRLSFMLQATADDPSVYLTWQLRPTDGGCVVRLQIDEVDDDVTGDDEIESIWLPVLASLQELLGAGVEPCDPRVIDSLTAEPAGGDE